MTMAQKSILVVDDALTSRLKLKTLCQELGVEKVLEAGDGEEGLKILNGAKVDLVLSDWHMPNMTGPEMVAKMREAADLAGIPVILVTAESEKGAILDSLLGGVTDFVVKPFDDRILKQKICGALKVRVNF